MNGTIFGKRKNEQVRDGQGKKGRYDFPCKELNEFGNWWKDSQTCREEMEKCFT